MEEFRELMESIDTIISNKLTQLDSLSKTQIVLSSEDRDHIKTVVYQAQLDLDKAGQTPLIIGILGGTGVGKSTIINVLAGSEISKTSHRRPITDRVIVYHYKDNRPELKNLDQDMIWISHDNDDIKHVIVCDLPDYDSLMSIHRHRVETFSQELDLLIWVTSPEKYGDGAMFKLIDIMNKSINNFCFVLNKIDQLSDNDQSLVMGKFTALLVQANCAGTPFFPISAKQALENVDALGASNMIQLKKWIFNKREQKEIQLIKSSNIEKELSHCLMTIRKKVQPLSLDHTQQLIAQLKTNIQQIQPVIEKDILWILYPEFNATTHQNFQLTYRSPGPVHLIEQIISHFVPYAKPNPKNNADHTIPKLISHLDHQMMRITTTLPGNRPFKTFQESFDQFIIDHPLHDGSIMNFYSLSWIKKCHYLARQWFSLLIPFIFFMIYVIHSCNLSMQSSKHILLTLSSHAMTIILYLFSPQGTTALVSLLCLELLICIYLVGSNQRFRIKIIQKFHIYISKKLTVLLLHRWDDTFKPIDEWLTLVQKEYMLLMDDTKFR